MKVILWPFIVFFMAKKLTPFNLKNKIDCTKLKEDQDYGSSLLSATDQQTKQGQALRRKK